MIWIGLAFSHIYIYIYILGHGLGYELGPEVAWLDGARVAGLRVKKNRLLNRAGLDNKGGPAGRDLNIKNLHRT